MSQAAECYCVFRTTMGFCGIAWDDFGITRFRLPTGSAEAARGALRRRLPSAEPTAAPSEIDQIIAAAKRYFEGERTDFSDVRLTLDDQDAFFRQIYTVVRQIGWGHTTTYGAIARQLGTGPETARDIGQAMAKNPIPLIIPCHRVVAAGGKLGGFSAPGGSTTKLRMLQLEGAHVEPLRPAQQAFAF